MSETDRPDEPQVPDAETAPPTGPPERPRPPVIHRPDLLVDLERGLKPVDVKKPSDKPKR